MKTNITGAEMIQEGKNVAEFIKDMDEWRFSHVVSAMIIEWCNHNNYDVHEFLADIMIYVDGLTIFEDLPEEEDYDDDEEYTD